jgi:hypothetical protein
LLLVVGLLAGSSWAATDHFVGKWKLNPSKSKLTDEMKVESAGGNKYAFDFGSGNAETTTCRAKCLVVAHGNIFRNNQESRQLKVSIVGLYNPR